MKLPKKWLCEYVDFNVTDEEFIQRMMWRGFELASVSSGMPGVEGVVVGRVNSVVKHENSDHLHICQVDVGSGEPLTIVTAADNVFDGALVPVAVVGAKLDGQEMKPVNMRGVDSFGMLCSGKELGLTNMDYPGSDVHGILILKEDYPVGQPMEAALGFDDVVFDFDLTPNRPDCASILGLCREAAAALGQTFTPPAIQPVKGVGDEKAHASVEIQNYDLCPRYTARVVTDIKIEPSPLWMQRKLRSVGLRPINNIVDITNYVLVEYGHPMHAFDLACVDEGHIIVRNAVEGEVVTTLDGKQRPVTPDMLLIADPKKGVGIAGVMGGYNSEITENTKAILFEAAVFSGSSIRSTVRKLRHNTDAAARFIKGVEPVNALMALDRAVELVDQLGAGTVVGKTIDVCRTRPVEQKVDVDIAHVNALLSLSLSGQQMADMLATIGISSKAKGALLQVTIPHFRTDIECGIEADWDIAEEIARIYGYYNIAPTRMRGDTFAGSLGPSFAFEDKVKDTLAALGCYEMYNYNFISPGTLESLRLPAESELRKAVKLMNPFGEDQSLMRTLLLPGMLDTASRNLNRRTGQGRFFEVGNVHIDLGGELPEERKTVGVMLFGNKETFFTLKGVLEQLLDRMGVQGATYARADDLSYYQPGRAARINDASGTCLGNFGQVHPSVATAWKIDEPIYTAELSFDRLLAAATHVTRFTPLPRFPVVTRDLAVVVDRNVESAALCSLIASAKTGLIVEDVRLFDTYTGPGLLPGKKSLAFSFTLRSDEHTLSDEEIKGAMAAIIDTLAEHGAPLRA